MRYMGGKFRLKKDIAKVLNEYRKEGQVYWEAFVGSAWVTTEIAEGDVICSDINPYLIEMWVALLDGWIPPENITEEQYQYIKEHKNENFALTSFVGFGCSWGGKWFGGYARDSKGTNYARVAKDSLLRKVEKLPRPITFINMNFLDIHVGQEKILFYCDPPYKSTTGYDAVDEWDSSAFWDKVRQLSDQGHTVIVSEYEAPEDFKVIAEFPQTKVMNTENQKETIERLFIKGE